MATVQTVELASRPAEPSPEEMREFLQTYKPSREQTGSTDAVPAEKREHLIRSAIKVLARHQHEVPTDIRIPLIEDIISGDYGDGVTMLASDLDAIRLRNPARLKVLWMLLDAVTLREGLRIIRDAPIQEHAKDAKERRRDGLITRWLKDRLLSDQQKNTELLQEAIDLASANDNLKRQKADLLAQNGTLREKTETILAEATATAERIMAEAQKDGTARLERADAQVREAQNKLKILSDEIANLEQLKANLLTDPELAKTYDALQTTEQKREEDAYLSKICGLSLFGLRTENMRKALLQFVLFFEKSVLEPIVHTEQKYGMQARISLVRKMTENIPKFEMQGYFISDRMNKCSTPAIVTGNIVRDIIAGLSMESVSLEKVGEIAGRLKERIQTEVPETPFLNCDTEGKDSPWGEVSNMVWSSFTNYYRQSIGNAQ